MCSCVRPCVNPELVCAISGDQFKPGSLNLDQRWQPWLPKLLHGPLCFSPHTLNIFIYLGCFMVPTISQYHPLHVYWSRQPIVCRRLMSLLFSKTPLFAYIGMHSDEKAVSHICMQTLKVFTNNVIISSLLRRRWCKYLAWLLKGYKPAVDDNIITWSRVVVGVPCYINRLRMGVCLWQCVIHLWRQYFKANISLAVKNRRPYHYIVEDLDEINFHMQLCSCMAATENSGLVIHPFIYPKPTHVAGVVIWIWVTLT